MNATTFAEFRAAASSNPHDEQKMDQIRELLFGDYQRQCDARLGLIEARMREIEVAVHDRLDDIQHRVEQLAVNATAENRAAFDELARGLADLGERVRRLR